MLPLEWSIGFKGLIISYNQLYVILQLFRNKKFNLKIKRDCLIQNANSCPVRNTNIMGYLMPIKRACF